MTSPTKFHNVQESYERMQKHLEEAWQNRAANLPYETPYDAWIESVKFKYYNVYLKKNELVILERYSEEVKKITPEYRFLGKAFAENEQNAVLSVIKTSFMVNDETINELKEFYPEYFV